MKEFLYIYKNGMLPRGGMFSVFYPPLLKEMMALFRLFYYANDFETFYKTALWARNNMNEGEYILALYNAVIKRPDTQYIQLPPPYELYPHYFFNSEVMEKAEHASLFGLRGNSIISFPLVLSRNTATRQNYFRNKRRVQSVHIPGKLFWLVLEPRLLPWKQIELLHRRHRPE